jgi:peptidoglycan/LPS O-acetylase OafA/YrhL
MSSRPDARIAPLAGLRFLAALGVLLFHYGAPLVAEAPAWARAVREGGHVWVGLFYVLSGFLLARAHPRPLAPGERRAFWVARLARIYPAYLAAFLLFAPFALERWAGEGWSGAVRAGLVALLTLLLVHAWIPPIARLWNAPGWSTSAVAAFYAAFPYLLGRLAPLGRRGLALAAAGGWAAALLPALLYLAALPDGPAAWELPREPLWLEALKFHPLARAGEFLAGVALGLLHARGQVAATAWAAPLALAGALGVLATGAAPYPLLHNGLLVPLFGAIVVGLAAARGPLARALGSRPLVALGDASFALYALQEPLWRWARALSGTDGAPATPAFVLVFAAGATLASVAVSRGLERPARRALRAWLGGALSARGAPREADPGTVTQARGG